MNCLPSQILDLESPYFRLHHCHPTYTNLHTFRCVCFMHLHPPHRNNLSAQSICCAFLGYNVNKKGYLCFDPHTNRVHIFRNVIFFENQCFFPLSSSSATSLVYLLSFNDTLIYPVFKLIESSHIWCTSIDYQCCPLQLMSCHLLILCIFRWILK